VNPSPNIRNLNEAILYPAIAMLEGSSNYSVGRGTETPFEQVGAEWIDGGALAQNLSSRAIPGVRFRAVEFTPSSSNLNGKRVKGVGIELTDRDLFSATRLGIEMALALGELYPGRMNWQMDRKLIGSDAVLAAFSGRKAASRQNALDAADAGVSRFALVREKYLLYK
jgi:uncharacterized protein YbbC (DUF1343 family)